MTNKPNREHTVDILEHMVGDTSPHLYRYIVPTTAVSGSSGFSAIIPPVPPPVPQSGLGCPAHFNHCPDRHGAAFSVAHSSAILKLAARPRAFRAGRHRRPNGKDPYHATLPTPWHVSRAKLRQDDPRRRGKGSHGTFPTPPGFSLWKASADRQPRFFPRWEQWTLRAAHGMCRIRCFLTGSHVSDEHPQRKRYRFGVLAAKAVVADTS